MIKFPSEELLDIAIQKHIVYRDWEQQKERQEIEARELQDYNNLYQIKLSECKPSPVVTEPAMNKELKPKLTFEEVCESLRLERTAQDQKWGPLEERRQSVSGYITILEAELSGAKKGWVRNVEGKHSSLAEIRQLAAVAIACLQQYGFEGTPL